VKHRVQTEQWCSTQKEQFSKHIICMTLEVSNIDSLMLSGPIYSGKHFISQYFYYPDSQWRMKYMEVPSIKFCSFGWSRTFGWMLCREVKQVSFLYSLAWSKVSHRSCTAGLILTEHWKIIPQLHCYLLLFPARRWKACMRCGVQWECHEIKHTYSKYIFMGVCIWSCEASLIVVHCSKIQYKA
jgi:hypothetical protein